MTTSKRASPRDLIHRGVRGTLCGQEEEEGAESAMAASKRPMTACRTRMQAMRRLAVGFTLIELLITIAVAAILMAVAVPSFQAVTCDSRGTAHVNSLISALAYTRSEAVRRGAPVILCPTLNGEECSNGTDWTGGWLARPDNGSDEVLRQWQRLSGNASLSGPNQVRYEATGAIGSEESFAYQLSAAGLSLSRDVVINAVGRPRTSEDRCSAS